MILATSFSLQRLLSSKSQCFNPFLVIKFSNVLLDSVSTTFLYSTVMKKCHFLNDLGVDLEHHKPEYAFLYFPLVTDFFETHLILCVFSCTQSSLAFFHCSSLCSYPESRDFLDLSEQRFFATSLSHLEALLQFLV